MLRLACDVADALSVSFDAAEIASEPVAAPEAGESGTCVGAVRAREPDPTPDALTTTSAGAEIARDADPVAVAAARPI